MTGWEIRRCENGHETVRPAREEPRPEVACAACGSRKFGVYRMALELAYSSEAPEPLGAKS